MYWVSSKYDDKFGITDSDDSIEEFYTEEELFDFIKNGVEILGVNENKHSIEIYGEIYRSDKVLRFVLDEHFVVGIRYIFMHGLHSRFYYETIDSLTYIELAKLLYAGEEIFYVDSFMKSRILDGNTVVIFKKAIGLSSLVYSIISVRELVALREMRTNIRLNEINNSSLMFFSSKDKLNKYIKEHNLKQRSRRGFLICTT